MFKVDKRKCRSRHEICLTLAIKISKKCNSKSITVKQRHVQSTSEKHLNKILGMLQVVNNETQSLVLTFNRFHILFRDSVLTLDKYFFTR